MNKGEEAIRREVRGQRLIGESRAIRRVIEEITLFAPTEALVILFGESGVGKDLVARVIHANSGRANKPFVIVDCATIPDELWESECFGAVRGAFTGARSRQGLFRQADGGSLFLNELQELSCRHQAKLKEFLECRRLRPVGAGRPIELDVRIIVASNRNLQQMVRQRRLAEDLYRRLGLNVIHIPSLRQRREDIPALIEYFAEQTRRRHKLTVGELSDGAERVLMEQRWPGNVRQLKNVLEAAWLRSRGRQIESDDLLRTLRVWERTNEEVRGDPIRDGCLDRLKAVGFKALREEYEKRLLMALLDHCGSLRQAARLAGLDASTLRARLKKFGLYRTNGGWSSPPR